MIKRNHGHAQFASCHWRRRTREEDVLRRFGLLCSLFAFELSPFAVLAQTWPDRTIKIIAPSAPGDRKSTRLNSSHRT
mgnify:CR=1 FL=1